MTQPGPLVGSRLLSALPLDLQKRLLPKLKRVSLELGDVIYESGATMRYVYFPIDSIVSLVYLLEDGHSAEVSVVGNEGIVGISVFMGSISTLSTAVVQTAGESYQLLSQDLRNEVANLDGSMRILLLRYTQTLIHQMAQTALCNRHHSIDQQLCRWLLLTLDRISGDHLIITQELISQMLGVRREGVTEAAGKLQRIGAIKYQRGEIEVLDRPALEHQACECYEVIRSETNRLLPFNL